MPAWWPVLLAEDPYESRNLALEHPDKVATMKARIEALGQEAAKPLGLVYITRVGLAHGKPVIASESSKAPDATHDHGPSITDEGVGDPDRP